MVEAGGVEPPSKTVGPSITTSVSPVLFSTPPCAGVARAIVQSDFSRSGRYRQKRRDRSGFY